MIGWFLPISTHQNLQYVIKPEQETIFQLFILWVTDHVPDVLVEIFIPYQVKELTFIHLSQKTCCTILRINQA